jgi:DNA-binding response OmpR family regulator/two-component sensor histidine kinase
VRLLQQILETSKSAAGQLRLLVAQGDVMKYIRQTAECLQPLIAKKDMTFSINCQPESMMGWIDTDKLDKIIYNLLSNAAKYGKEGGTVSLSAITNDKFDEIEIKVCDDGEGISAKQMKNLFKRFHDGDYRQHQTIGTGLGLSLTKDLVYLNRGTITCHSEEGKGTAFTVKLPIKKEAFAPDQIDEKHKIVFNMPQNAIIDINTIVPDINAEPEDPIEDGYKLLVVEDNLELLMLMQQLLKRNYHVYIARNGNEAMRVIREKELDLIISDIMMPEMDGIELTKAVKADPNTNHLPIILLTAKTQEEDEKEALQSGADEYLRKPFRLGDLKLRIDNIIENRKRMQTEYSQLSAEEEAKHIAKAPSPDESFVNHVLEHIHKHINDESYDRDALAADMGTSASTLYNKLRSITGMNVSAFIRDVRMKEARRLGMENPNLRVSDLAYSVGFHDPRYFATCFKKQFGTQPKEFLESLQHSKSKGQGK